MTELLEDLRSLTSTPKGGEFNRKNIIALLEVLNQHLGSALATPSGTLEDGTEVVEEHPAAALLRMLGEAIGDLDIGKVDDVFRRTPTKANATRPWRIREDHKLLIEALEIFQQLEGIHTRSDAARRMASKLNSGVPHTKRLNKQAILNIYNRYKYQ